MPRERQTPAPRTFFLNEQHELARGEKEGGGSLPKLAPIDWKAKGQRIHRSLKEAREAITNSQDPLRTSRYFLATLPTATVKKMSSNVRRAPEGLREEKTDYAGEHSRVFKRLGLDLLAVDDEGQALIHAPAARIEQLLATANALPSEGRREQARWVTIDSFRPAPVSFRIDHEWLEAVRPKTQIDAVVELQPLLSRTEVEQVIRAIIEALGPRAERERFTRTGTDFSGRHWYRGVLSRESLLLIAERFFSVQALHPPLRTAVAAKAAEVRTIRTAASARRGPNIDPALLPVVAVVDVGLPAEHAKLSLYRRGRYVSPDAPAGLETSHACLVASRVVFGDPDFSAGVGDVTGSCAFLDVNVAADRDHIDDKAVLAALQAVVGAYPDVRVFNLSFGEYTPLSSHPSVERREKMLLLQDLDNFVFRSDVIVVVAAGNSRPGVAPATPYPNHVDDPQWALGSWACGFNTLTCGSYVGRLSPGGIVKNLGWPSPFTRIGPGLCDAMIPEFSANGGNCNDQFQFLPGHGVWACNAAGMWEDYPGTSLAAPLLAREAAFAMAELQQRCEQGARPFAATVKAFLALTAVPPNDNSEAVAPLVQRTLGRGTAASRRLLTPGPASAVMIWQGVLSGPEDKARLQVPVPAAWLQEAGEPTIRVVAAWESPVNEAVEHIWASRKVEFQFRPTPSTKALTPRGKNHASYPLLDRHYDLSADALKKSRITPPGGDFWVLEISYKEIAEYAATVEFSAHQRIGVVMELVDHAEQSISPQSAMQALPQAVTMSRLTVPENRIANPIIVRPRM
jgi:hypothetical protein